MAGKITAAFTSITQETTIALANLNFDFALYKVEAPKEYSGVGRCLSKKRREAAENGNEHMVARRLGALFAQALPATPTLIKAYGIRCSEISELSAAAPKGVRSKTLFEDWIGADATSIWAAATSGNGAIPVHLLACMLARVWSAAEATAIWEELIEHRKTELAATEFTDPSGITLLTASRIEVTRDQISRWDASARSWISVADTFKKKEQTQLMLLTSDLSIPISESGGVYGSVMSAWKHAMEIMEGVLNQTSQSIRNGAGLVGLASWHLYPNIYALEAVEKTVKFRDPLVPSGVLITIGAGYSSDGDGTSVYWSLPLACLRYYGDPVPTSSSMTVTSARLSMPECMYVALGSIFHTWGRFATDLDAACGIIIAFSENVMVEAQPVKSKCMNWLQHLSEAAKQFLTSQDGQKKWFRTLIARGQRRYPDFFAEKTFHPLALFDLCDPETLIRLIKYPNHKIAVLRYIAENWSTYFEPGDLIRWPRSDLPVVVSVPIRPSTEPQAARSDNPITCFSSNEGCDSWQLSNTQVASASTHPNKRPKLSSSVKAAVSEATCLPAGSTLVHKDCHQLPQSLTLQQLLLVQCNPIGSRADGSPDTPAINPHVATMMKGNRERHRSIWEFATAVKTDCSTTEGDHSRRHNWSGYTRWIEEVDSSEPGECMKGLESIRIVDHGQPSFTWIEDENTTEDPSTDALQGTTYQCIFGDPDDIAIFRSDSAPMKGKPEITVTVDLLLHALKHRWIDPKMLVQHLNNIGSREYLRSLRGLAAAADVYKLMPRATINPNIFSRPICQASWTEPRSSSLGEGLWKFEMSRGQTMACIANLENVMVDLSPNSLRKVMALSCGNSIYVSASLVCDPFETPGQNAVRHIIGNIGRPGVSLMIPPMAPRTRKVDDTVWTHVNHEEFDGSFDDCFQHTSLHLNFTGYELPVVTTSHGQVIADAFYVESVVSVFDRSTWVADVDIFGGLAKPGLIRMDRSSCRHVDHTSLIFPITSIDCWEEYLDPPANDRIFRSNGNWLARLAVAAHNTWHNRWTILFKNGDSVCWQCVRQALQTNGLGNFEELDEVYNKGFFIC